MPRAPSRFNDPSEVEDYLAPDPRTWNAASTSSYAMGAPQISGPPAHCPSHALPYTGPTPEFPPRRSSKMPNTPHLSAQGYHMAQMSVNQQLRFQMQQSAGQMPPPPFPPPHVGRTPTQVDNRPPDYWHSNKNMMCINLGKADKFPHSVSYRPTNGPCTFGVALLNLEYGRGMVAPTERLDEFMPPQLMRYANGALLLDWPGYRQENFILTLVDPQTRRHVTRAALGAQVTQIFKDFVNSRKDSDFTDHDGAMRVGIDGVSYDQVRLVEVYTKDGMSYRAQFGLNAHYLAVGA
ncbi:hypothetical protein DFH06DRAFT_344438 [Mycena polygramma]|nr:hypothetical protein DFH06DRAFT_344438 [Mycena polygramma]